MNVLLPAVAKAWLQAFPPARAPRDRQLQQVVNSGYLKLSRTTGINIEHLGLHAYRIRRRFCRRAILERIADLRFKIPPPTHMTWTKGKGVIGICWQKEQWAIADTKKAYEQAQVISADGWPSTDKLITMGLTQEQLERTKDYGVIATQPIFQFNVPRKIVGCLAVTAPTGNDAKLDTQAVKELLSELSALAWAAWNSRES